ncbi:MAG: hypothetical protein Q8K79_18490 [Solirubrobacteraceae bacterium]|nr:hypothetical protein [Solirubrobacteraceae bacterium]
MNVLRSIQRTVSVALGPEWEVGSAVEGTWARPCARVIQATPVHSTPHGARFRDLSQGYSVAAWPVAFAVTADAALAEALRVETLLRDAFTRGVESAHFRAGRASPLRVPLLDYSAVPPDRPRPICSAG